MYLYKLPPMNVKAIIIVRQDEHANVRDWA